MLDEIKHLINKTALSVHYLEYAKALQPNSIHSAICNLNKNIHTQIDRYRYTYIIYLCVRVKYPDPYTLFAE